VKIEKPLGIISLVKILYKKGKTIGQGTFGKVK